DWATMSAQGLAYFFHSLTDEGEAAAATGGTDEPLETLIARGLVRFDPIIYEDFLPVSAAGIFQSNLGDEASGAAAPNANRTAFEAALGAATLDEFAHYADLEARSIRECRDRLHPAARQAGYE